MTNTGGIAVERLRSDIYAEAKSAGFDVKVLRRLIKERKQEPADLEEQEALLDVYRHALGQLADTPLGRAMEPA